MARPLRSNRGSISITAALQGIESGGSRLVLSLARKPEGDPSPVEPLRVSADRRRGQALPAGTAAGSCRLPRNLFKGALAAVSGLDGRLGAGMSDRRVGSDVQLGPAEPLGVPALARAGCERNLTLDHGPRTIQLRMPR